METKFNFKSQICTSIVQSRRLLELGLKKETADMYLQSTLNDVWSPYIPIAIPYSEVEAFNLSINVVRIIPAWSLHRLIEMMPPDRKYEWLTISKNDVFYRCIHFGEEDFIGPNYCGDNLYDSFIIMYEWLIKEGYFPKEYLV